MAIIELLGFSKKTTKASFTLKNSAILKNLNWNDIFKKDVDINVDKHTVYFKRFPLVKIKGFEFNIGTNARLEIVFQTDQSNFLGAEIGLKNYVEFINKALTGELSNIFKRIEKPYSFEGLFFIAKQSSSVVLIPYTGKEALLSLEEFKDKYKLVDKGFGMIEVEKR